VPLGVQVLTGARPGPSDLLSAPASTYFVAGISERGDVVNPVVVRSMAEYAAVLGDRVAYGALYDDLDAFFGEGGVRAYVARVVGPAASVGTLTLVDRAGAPASTLRIDAANPGAWSTRLSVQVDNDAITNTFKLTILYDGLPVEVYPGLVSPADAAARLTASALVKVTNLGSATAAPNSNPAVLAATALSAGNDDRASIVSASYVAALARFTSDLGAGAVAIPGQPATNVGAGLIAHVSARNVNRIALLSPAAATSQSVAISDAAALRSTSGSEFAGYFFPWVTVADGVGGTRTIAPTGYVAGVRARLQNGTGGPWQAPAGEVAIAQHIVGVESAITADQASTLHDSRVNPIRPIAGALRLYGWRSLSSDELNYRRLLARDTLNYVAVAAAAALEQFVFKPVDGKGHLFARIAAEIQAILEPIHQAGGLYELHDAGGNLVDPGYLIDTGPNINTPAVLANNEVRVAVSMRLSPGAELITLTVTKVAFTSTL
jgi:hypothetical protein